MSNEYDFGFSFSDSDESATSVKPDASEDLKLLQTKIDSVLSQNEEIYKAKLKEVEGLILPLLYNLMKNPEKVYIKWENRTEVIQKQIDRIIAITRS